MNDSAPIYRGYRFPPEIISHAMWLYYRFSLSFRDVEDLLAQRGIIVSYEKIAMRAPKAGPPARAPTSKRPVKIAARILGLPGLTWLICNKLPTIRETHHRVNRRLHHPVQVCDFGEHPKEGSVPVRYT